MAACAVSRSLGTISSSRCQTTRACKRRVDATHCMREFIFTDEHLTSWSSPPSLKLRRDNLRGSKAGLPTEAAIAAKVGGARRDRTDDLLLAKQALSQLSYGPGCRSAKVVGLGRLELPTSRLSSARSNQLSYKPNDRPRSSPNGMRAARARP